MATRRLLEAAAMSALLLWPTLAWAGPGPGDAKFEEGVRANEKGSYAEAAADFSAAYDASHSATHLWNLALAEFKAGHPWAAFGDLTAYTMSPDANAQNLDQAFKLMDRMKQQIGHLAVSAPAGTEVLVDGVSKGKTNAGAPFEIDVDPATPHVVEGHLGQRVAHNNVPATGASRVEVALDLPEDHSPPPVAPPMPHEIVAPPKPASAPEEPDHIPNQGLLAVLVVAEVTASAASAGIGAATFVNGNTDHDSGKQALGGVLIGAGVLFLAADVLTMRLWPRSSKPDNPATSQVLISPGLGGLSLHGAS
jgi:hypothetical protein